MATSITPWLEATLTDQLFLGNGWLQHKHRTKREGLKPDPDQLWKDVYRDNGSCLDIITDHHDPKNKTNLRILQLSPLTLTDGQTYITAHLTDECHRDLYTRHSLSETQPTQAAPSPILAVRKYILQHTPYGPPRDRLRFILHSFDWLGHSAEPLGELRSLFQSEDITSFVAQLHNTRIKEDRRCLNRRPNQAEERESSRPGPDSDGVVASMSSPNTQIPYGTQFVQPAQRRAAQDNASSPAANKAGPTQTGQARPASDVRMAQLLTLLAPKGPQSAPNPEPQPQLKPPHPDVPSTGGFRKPSPKIVNTPPGNQQTIAKHQTTESSHRESTTPLKQHIATPQSRKIPVTPRESPYEKHQQLAQSSNNRGKKRAADEAASLHEPQGSLEDDSQPQAQSDLDDMDEMDLYTSQSTWMNDLPLTRGILRIPLDQQKLLDRPESWQKPQAGHRFPSGNIPIMTLNLLSELADEAATAEQQSNPEQEMDLDSSSSTESDEESAIEPDKEPGSELAQSQADEPDDSPSATQPSWSQSPTPEPPKRLHQLGNALPPDSSFGNQVDTADSPLARTSSAARQSRVSPISIKSSNPFNTVEPPSSPPSLRAVEASEDEMEMETAVPQGLGQDIMDTSYPSQNKQLTNTPNPLKSSVQVEETPYINFKSRDVAGKIKAISAHNQTSSGTSKHTSSTSIIYASYEPHVSSKEHASQKQAVSVDGYDGQNDHADPVELQPEEENQSHIQALAEANHGKSEDVVMEDAPGSSPASRSWSPSPVGEDSLAHQATLAKSNNPDELTTSFTKRKFEASPSKKIRQPKRREIKIVGFGADSPPSADPASSIRRQRDESLQRFREERRADQIASKQSASPGWIQEKFPVVKIEPELSPPPQPTSQTMPKSTETSTVFERFKAAYPEYTADFRHFKGQCKSMYELEIADKMVSKWMWDDFIIRNRTDYKKYAAECIDRGEEVEPYHRFYKDNIRDTIYQKGIIASRTTLMQALEELGVKPAAPEPSESPKRALRNPDDVVARTKSPPRDRPRHSLPVSSVQHRESATLPTKSSTRDRPRHSLPIGSHKSLTTLTSSQAHSKSSSRISSVPRSTPIPPPSSESTGDPFRDFIFAQQRMTSFTGSTKVDPNHHKWPQNLATRQSVLDALEKREGKRKVDVLAWNDKL